MKFYAVTFLICFTITMIVLAAAIVAEVMECKRVQAKEGEVIQKPMKKRDKMLLIPRMVLIAALLSIPAPLTLIFYAILVIYMIFAPEN